MPTRYHTITVRRKSFPDDEWVAYPPEGTLTGWPTILDYAAHRSWDLLSTNVERYSDGSERYSDGSTAVEYRLFFREPG